MLRAIHHPECKYKEIKCALSLAFSISFNQSGELLGNRNSTTTTNGISEHFHDCLPNHGLKEVGKMGRQVHFLSHFFKINLAKAELNLASVKLNFIKWKVNLALYKDWIYWFTFCHIQFYARQNEFQLHQLNNAAKSIWIRCVFALHHHLCFAFEKGTNFWPPWIGILRFEYIF